ncbi:MAG: hypothetical protein Q8K89_04030 [Actinomycetota bacterium]|nr:hypothetical protein [Coriobacteriia bacterium]MDP2232782.1 hypothetical protein [Actinomycetota bacterium]
MAAKPARTLLLILMDLLIVLAVLMTAALVIGFFGALSGQAWGQAVLKIAGLAKIPVGITSIKTPYGGVFSVDFAISVAIYLVGEWLIGSLRSRA